MKQQTIKLVFDNSVKLVTGESNTDLLIYYNDDTGELKTHSIPKKIINEFIHIDKNEIVCPICKSPNMIYDIDDSDIIHFDNIRNWECKNCGSNEGIIQMKKPEIKPSFPTELMIDSTGHGILENLKLNNTKKQNHLCWFRVPHRLMRLLKYNNNAFKETMPLFKYYEKDYYIYLQYQWYLDGIQHKLPDSNHLIDDCRVSNKRYLRPPKHFNDIILRSKYDGIWNYNIGSFKWWIENNYVKFQIRWDKQKYQQEVNNDV